MKKEIRVVYVLDENYVMPTCVSVCSLIYNNQNSPLMVYILGRRLSYQSKRIFIGLRSNYVNLHIYDVDNKIEDLLSDLNHSSLEFDLQHITSSSMIKFFIPNLLKNEDKVLYLDGDTIVNAKLDTLYSLNIEEQYVAAVDDMIAPDVDGFSVRWKQLGKNEKHYFNSGVMLLNLKKMREERVTDKLIDYKLNEKNIFMDQDAFNMVLSGKRYYLSYFYNFLPVVFENLDDKEICEIFFEKKIKMSSSELVSNSYIIHFAGSAKPWDYNIPWATEMFEKYYKISPYSKTTRGYKSYSKYLHNKLSSKYYFVPRQKEANIMQVPYDLINQGSKLILYGAGKQGKRTYVELNKTKYAHVSLWVDINYISIDYMEIEGLKQIKIFPPSKIKEVDYDYILVTVRKYEEEIYEQLINEYKVNYEKIIFLEKIYD